ncbi:MAG: 16S rRNA (cytosine(1402)-N(4))-methyltransferase RsmH [Eubacteriales bacterium]
MELEHTSVLLKESIEGLNIRKDGIYVDCTLGGAGHSCAICRKLHKDGTLMGIDQDEYAIERATEKLKDYQCNKKIIHDNFLNIKLILKENGIDNVDGILMDLGVSSFQLDDAQRGFSYHHNTYLDMRMDRRKKISAFNVINEYSEKDLSRVIKSYGEEKFASRIARGIVEQRNQSPIEYTFQLVEIIKKSIPAKFRREGPHPARRTFQAIRIEVNNELEILANAVKDSVQSLNSKGRICIITFHSLEDRIVKQTLKYLSDPCQCPKDFPHCICGEKPIVKLVTKKPIYPSLTDIEINPRSRSAKLRIAQKI